MSFFSELQRRNVWRVALLYLVASWLVLQVTDILVPALALPDFALRLVTLVLLLGFPLALLFSWVYELTPEGLKREKDVVRDESITHATGRKLNLAIIALLALTIGGLVLDRVVPKSTRGTTTQSNFDQSEVANDGATRAEIDGVLPDLSIAVLPFEVRGAEGDDRILALAVSDQLRMLLTRDNRLMVTGSISSDIAAKAQLNAPEMREQLGVAHILRGTATAIAGKLQVQAELIGTSDGFNVWSQGYEREAGDLSGVPEDIAGAVIDAITGDSSRDDAATTSGEQSLDRETYRAYLTGEYFLDRDDSVADYERAVVELQRVVDHAPDYAMGWARLSRAYLGIGGRNFDEQALQSSRIAAERAIALSPDLAEAWAVLAAIKITSASDFPGAYVAAQRAMRLGPNMEYPLRTAALLEAAFGEPEEAMRISSEATVIDPLSTKALRNACLYAMYAGELDLAVDYGMRALDINESAVVIPYLLARAHAAKGDIAEAYAILDRESVKPFRDFGRAYVLLAEGDTAKSREQIDFLVENYSDIAALNIAELKSIAGKSDEAFEWLDAALEARDTGLFEARSMPGLRVLHDDPRWQAFIEQAGLNNPR